MDLSPKILSFTIEAIEFRLQWYRSEIEREVDKDRRSDLENDLLVMETAMQVFRDSHFSMMQKLKDRFGKTDAQG